MHPFYKDLGHKIKSFRLKRGLTQHELAEKAGLTTAFLSYLENGTRKGSLDAYLKLMESMGLAPDSLFGKVTADKDFYSVGVPMLSLEGLSPADSRAVKGVVRSLRAKKQSKK